MLTEQDLRELTATLFASLITVSDRECRQESIALMSDMIECGAIRSAVARGILRDLVRNFGQATHVRSPA
jgi:hypothetical protein